MKREQEFLRDSYRRKMNMCMEVLRTHLGNDIVFTGTWEEAAGEREPEEEELLEGELSALIFTIGCYTVRIAECMCEDGSSCEAHNTEGKIAGLDRIKSKACMVTEVSARYTSESQGSIGSWTNIYTAVPCRDWTEEVDYMCSVKESGKARDEEAVLFIFINIATDSNVSGKCYKFTPEGKVEEYSIGYGWDNPTA